MNLNLNATVDLDLDLDGSEPAAQRGPTWADNPAMLSFQRLRVYQKSIEFLALALEVIAELPKGHAELADQLLRAAQSQPRNIAEGAGRRTAADGARFYAIARGASMEAAAALDTMRVMKVVADDAYDRGIDLLEAVVAMLTRMI